MGQCATLYSIDKMDFSKITDNPDDVDIFKIAKESVFFDKTFDGHIFVLSKCSRENTKLISEIFYPEKFVGEEIDFNTLDLDNVPDDFDFNELPVYYNDPDKVNTIIAILDKISLENYKDMFDPDELNQEHIYPGEVWNRETGVGFAFNRRSMSEEFIYLKDFFHRNRDSYLISLVE